MLLHLFDFMITWWSGYESPICQTVRLHFFKEPVQMPNVHLAVEMSLDPHSLDPSLLKVWSWGWQYEHHGGVC